MADDLNDQVPKGEPPAEEPRKEGSPSRGIGRFWEWLWLGGAMAEARTAYAALPVEAIQAASNAQRALEVAQRTWRPERPFVEGVPHAIVCELCRQATYWSLLALVRRAGVTTEAAGSTVPDMALLWEQTRQTETGSDASAQPVAANSSGEGAEPVEVLGSGSFVDFAGLPKRDAARLASQLWPSTQALVDSLGCDSRVSFVWRQRLLRWLLVVGIVALGAAAFASVRSSNRLKRDLAVGASWRASSSNGMGCRSPEQACSESVGFFVHTKRQSKPWIVFDLGADQQVSAVHVTNRLDCCQERAIPLSVEVRSAGGKWSQVARQGQAFSGTWVAEFETVTAREVRLRILRTDYLHLSKVRILP